ncbi:hypothetical protein N0V82_008402 [Gnomoniopsis sp. IMI 355080]|nr:hypothetical protein N0V82_008402 [Gnomoniopsis sp. IMI 355080]
MEYYLNFGTQRAAHKDNDMGNPEFVEMNLDELDEIARQLEWDISNDIDITTTHICEDNTTQEHTIPGAVMEPWLSSHCCEYNPSDTTLESPLFGSPDTPTTASLHETPAMQDYETPGDWAASWDTDALGIIPALLDFPLVTELEWPMLDDSWLNVEFDSAAAWEEPLQHQLAPRGYASSAETNAAVSSTAMCPASKASTSEDFNCSFCSFTATSITKLKTHINKHTRPFRCTAPSCDYATAEKKSLQRHVLAKAKWDEGHRMAAEGLGVKEIKYRCIGAGCGYVTIREDNLRRHEAKCPALEGGTGRAK